jgi:putative SOS response-associated peptidase YedK
MCGRFTNRYTWRELHTLYSLTDRDMIRSNFPPRYNIAPTQKSLIVRETNGVRELADLRWGLVPSWAKDTKGAARCINARAETVADKPSFRSAFKSRPCLVVADGYYEWKVVGPKEKQPYYFTLKNKAPFAFAGIWEAWKRADGDPLETFALLTTTPNQLCSTVHDRMPLILGREDWSAWLATPDDRKALLRPFPADLMQTWPVGKAVGNVKNDGPELIQPI